MTTDSPIIVAPHPSIPGVATFTMNRPKALNALNESMTKAFVPAIQAVANDLSIRVLIVQGEGEHFMAGGDIKGFSETLATPGEARKKHFLEMIHFLHSGIE
ncbi:MAG: enoyl-CoA hydratase/isomerase family protein, partial [Burkholderiales bacterium]